MQPAILLDTHIAVWLDAGRAQLRESTRAFLDMKRAEGVVFYLSAVSVWELAQLVDRRRIQLRLPVDEWAADFQQSSGIEALPLTCKGAALSYSFEGYANRDPADRLLMASAVENQCPLLTYDRAILDFAGRYGNLYGLEAMSA